jgi:endonuclease/exonuclease/phosphatase family metal-dependent hydrolase
MPDLGVMTFNVRQMDGEDGPQAWEYRKDVLIETIRRHGPALLGTQETWDEQSRYILANVANYRAFGRGRYGDDRDKHNKIFYDATRLTLLQSGEIWFSHTPEVPGSMAWGIPSPRMISWGRLRLDGGMELVAMNTHFPYGRADEARAQAARMVLEWITGVPAALPIVLTGDFNALATSEIHRRLTSGLQDAWESASETRGPEGTFHGFGRTPADSRVDWILYRHATKVLSAETVTDTAGGLYPSDHYPVSARLHFPESAQ